MSVSVEKMSRVLQRMACFFRPPVDLTSDAATTGVAQLWVSVLGDDFDDESVAATALILARSLRRFPTPADFLELTPILKQSEGSAARAAIGTVAQGSAA